MVDVRSVVPLLVDKLYFYQKHAVTIRLVILQHTTLAIDGGEDSWFLVILIGEGEDRQGRR
jgi:hypothetical protein